MRSDFGDEIAELVDGVTKLDKVKYGEATQAETVRKMVVAMARDIRVLVIIPALNEASTLPSVLADLRAAVPDCDVVVVDDGSTDQTAAVARAVRR